MTKWEYVDEGQEALVRKGTTDMFESFGGVIKYEKPITAAWRINSDNSDGQYMFCKHLVMKILDDCFLKRGDYHQEHIPRPLGHFDNGYFYEFAEGTEGFPLTYIDEELRVTPVDRKEWNKFSGLFNTFGFSVGTDIADVDYGVTGKNIIYEKWDMNDVYKTGKLHDRWKRIDFGSISCPFNYEKFNREMKDYQKELVDVLEEDYYVASMAAKHCQVGRRLEGTSFLILKENVMRYIGRVHKNSYWRIGK